ncbi:glycoside hydrolase family 97 catalytic domain-containing protein [Hymenobacter sp. M29]|uniref:Glycoside hydrolase family 97 catalytic domain-containing protein n=1 Tax=Hymenobacter mellowenesis TaxID=3063995 RepID=A0ABT9A8S8_9BACT|nr:glycoside hydrolase family 97 protein [Hymenobacter sp. M29]MDO7846251.1 glycoside hydrolase family 97 catalytic domain-containing protein [Hymenobacter sp. M29]
MFLKSVFRAGWQAGLVVLVASMVGRGQTPGALPGTQTVLHSPDGKLAITVYQRETAPGKRRLFYHVERGQQPVVLESGLDIQVDNHVFEHAMALPVDQHADWSENLTVKNTLTLTKDTTWTPVYGERSQIRDHYNQAEIQLAKADNPDYRVSLQVRAYDEGVAFRYFFPEHPKGIYYRVMSENDEFTLPAGTKAYYTAWAQGKYDALPLSNWPEPSERPLTVALPGGLYASLCEAGLTDYAMTKFKLSPTKPNTVVTSLYESVDLISPVGTPWRAVIIGEKPGDLLEHNDLLLNLNPPTKLKDTSWIKPGKIIREMTLTTQGAKDDIDFAAAHGLQYILFDWKWYGPAFSFSSDVTKVVAPIDMPAVIQYGKEKGIGVWLYVNQQGLLAQMRELAPLYKKWGVKGIKFGFVQVGSHRWTTWLTDAVQVAMDNDLMVNIHDEYRPTGTSRTYPNVMTQEGIRGNEEFPDATHNTVLPFTRFVAGAGDYTICYYDKRLKTTHAHQLALAAVYYSPIQTLFWYDKPSAYQGEPEVEFFEKVPTTWDETRVVQGEIGQYITVARRKGKDWFVGTITNNDGRTLKLPLNFLPKGQTFTASIYADDPSQPTRTKVGIKRQRVKAGQVLDVKLLPSGGQAIWLTSAE